MYPFILALLCLAIINGCQGKIDADKAAELSREIREHFRRTGANWVSPKMFLELNLTQNSKPIMFVFTSRSCADCRAFMDSWGELDKVTVSSLTAQFLSVLALDDYAFEVPELGLPTADYLPRVIFADPDGKVLPELKNSESDPFAPFFYERASDVVEVMRKALAQHWEYMGTDVFRGDLQQDIL
ncbi:hypothetical protein Vretimale_13186 [Volvox reticuliferus]|uniref:Thioredoxin domain-containing protein n=1 Tax=Volvox reticuliferus TaxID=1737510 RepID=A0A8J4GJU9_9CHLO|nr:hypothetical protein Vretifemale_14210 [Volvox reticuliferus]GIM09358.1 hypothetical protein Vretimale_13186 [Volvox reticuliferus]